MQKLQLISKKNDYIKEMKNVCPNETKKIIRNLKCSGNIYSCKETLNAVCVGQRIYNEPGRCYKWKCDYIPKGFKSLVIDDLYENITIKYDSTGSIIIFMILCSFVVCLL